MSKNTSKIKLPINSIKETSWSAILLFSTIYCIYVTFVNLVIFKANFLQPISELTLGLINRTLLANIVSIIIFIFLIILKFGRLNVFDLGIKKNRLLAAVISVAIVWISMQLFNVIVALIISGKPIIDGGWSKYGATKMFGYLIGQLFGNSLFEELAFRGFLLVQICKKLNNTKRRFATGIIVSQMLFALIHIPNRILSGMNIVEILLSLTMVFLIGIFFATIYLLTDNIFLAVGLHALWDTPLLVFDGLPSVLFIFIATIILLTLWNRIFNRLNIDLSSPLYDLVHKT